MSGSRRLQVDLRSKRGELQLDVSFEVAFGETVALLGPNGAGKTSTLLAIAGLLPIDQGSLRFDGADWDSGSGGVFVVPERRRVGFAFQDHVLWPHLSVLRNVAYGLKAAGRSGREAESVAADWLRRVGVPESMFSEKPEALSGGQSQRVAIARALAPSPELLLLDEPLASVDASARVELRRELREHLDRFEGPRVLIVHDVSDAFALADRIVVLEGGRVIQSGSMHDLVERPRSRYVADLVGLNCFAGACSAGVVTIDEAELTVATKLEGSVLVTVHPRAISLFRQRPEGSPRNVWEAPVEALEPTLERVRVRLGGRLPLVAEVTPAAVSALRLDEGGSVFAAIKATEIQATER